MLKKIIESIRTGVCFNQEELAQFSYLASFLHKALKEGLASNDEVPSLRTLRISLTDFLNKNTERISLHNFSLLKSYYKSYKNSSFELPRICIKGHYKEKIVDLFRSDNLIPKGGDPIESNTGFNEVYNTGKYFLCNNIPDLEKNLKYINPRLDSKKATAYNKIQVDFLLKFIINIGNILFDKSDTEWAMCWNDYNSHDTRESINRSFYKSTLIVPMTLWNSQIQQPLADLFKLSDSDTERMIFGYLCFDHTSVDFFDSIDIEVGYIYADLISLYIINNLMYTSYSNTYKKVLELENEYFKD